MIDKLLLACQVCETGATIERFRHIVFENGTMRVFNGIVYYEALTDFAKEERFVLSELKLDAALRACEGEGLKVSTNQDFLILKRGKLTVRVRRLNADNPELNHPVAKRLPKQQRVAAAGLLSALKAVAPFASSDASRPWSVSVLVKDGYLWATNNLSMVRSPIPDKKLSLCIPGAVVPILALLPSVDYVCVHEGLVAVWCGRSMLTFPQMQAEWPDVAKFFDKRPKKLPELDPELLEAAKTVEKFADRFVTLNDSSIEGKMATIESEYEVAVKKGKGTYSARLLSLVLTYATHADFNQYPNPIPFLGDMIEGVAVGIRPEVARP